MKLQPASRKEIKRIAIGTAVCDALMIALLFLLSLFGIGSFDYTVFNGAAGGSAVAIANFTLLCLTVQNAVGIQDEKRMQSFMRGSYNGRLLLQAVWLAVAFLVSHVHVVAAALPLLFPNLTIFWLRSRGDRQRQASEDHPGGFEV